MNGQKISVYQDRTIGKLMSRGGLKIIRASHSAGMKPEAALFCVAQKVTKLQSYERIEEVSAHLIDMPMVRGRLRQAGFTLPVRKESGL